MLRGSGNWSIKRKRCGRECGFGINHLDYNLVYYNVCDTSFKAFDVHTGPTGSATGPFKGCQKGGECFLRFVKTRNHSASCFLLILNKHK